MWLDLRNKDIWQNTEINSNTHTQYLILLWSPPGCLSFSTSKSQHTRNCPECGVGHGEIDAELIKNLKNWIFAEWLLLFTRLVSSAGHCEVRGIISAGNEIHSPFRHGHQLIFLMKVELFDVLEWKEGSNRYTLSCPDCGMLKRPCFHYGTPK